MGDESDHGDDLCSCSLRVRNRRPVDGVRNETNHPNNRFIICDAGDFRVYSAQFWRHKLTYFLHSGFYRHGYPGLHDRPRS